MSSGVNLKNGHPKKYVFLKEIGHSGQNVLTILDSMINIIWDPYTMTA